MNKSQLIDALAARYEGNRKSAQHALEAVLDTITREVARGEKVAITGFGSFDRRIREARWVRNPRTGDKVKAKKKAIPKFTAGADLKAVVSGAKKLPKMTLSALPGGQRSTGSSTTRSTSSSTGSTTKRASSGSSSAGSSAARKSPAKKATAKKTTAKKTTAKKATAKKATAKKTSTAKKTTARKTAKKSS